MPCSAATATGNCTAWTDLISISRFHLLYSICFQLHGSANDSYYTREHVLAAHTNDTIASGTVHAVSTLSRTRVTQWRSNAVGRVSKVQGVRVQGPRSCRQKITFTIISCHVGSRGSWCVDPPNDADIVLSRAQNLQVGLITTHNYLRCTGLFCKWVKLNRFADFGL